MQDTIAASSRAGYSLLNQAAPPPAVANPLTVTEVNGIYTVDTGVATFVIDSANPALLDEVSINATTLYQDVATAGPVLTLAGGATVLDRSLPGAVVVDPGTFALVDSGPLKAVFAINAHFVDAANARTLCADFKPGIASYESIGYTLILTLTRGTGDLDLQVNFRNECLDARFQPFTQGAETIDRLAWNLPLDLPNAASPLYAANGMMQNTSQTVVLEQGHGGGTPWLRQATVSLGGVVTANSEILADPVVALADNQFSVLAQMPWMRFREPQALEAGNDRIVLDLISEPTMVGGGKVCSTLPASASLMDSPQRHSWSRCAWPTGWHWSGA